MPLNGTVASATPGILGFDLNERLEVAQALQYYAKGFRFCVRYVSRDDASHNAYATSGSPDLAEDEAVGILASGMALMAVQHVQTAGWVPNTPLGSAYGANAAR